MTEKGVDYESVHYLDKPLSRAELKQLLRNDALRKNEASYRAYVAGKELSDSELIGLMAKHPELIQRPIVVQGNKAVLARPVERLGELELK